MHVTQLTNTCGCNTSPGIARCVDNRGRCGSSAHDADPRTPIPTMENKRYGRGIAATFVALTPLLAVSAACDTVAVPDPDVRFVAFGDSTTAGPSERDYPDILREMLEEPVEAFANEGVGGEASEDGLQRLRDILEAELFPNAEVWLHWEGGGERVLAGVTGVDNHCRRPGHRR